MSLARDIYDLWIQAEQTGVDAFLPLERSGVLDLPAVGSLQRRMEEADIATTQQIIRLCFQVLSIQKQQLQQQVVDTELVTTVPNDLHSIGRKTKDVIREMIAESEREVIILGYEVTDLDTFEELVQAATRGIEIIIISDRMRGMSGRLLAQWPAHTALPRFFTDKADERRPAYSSMHAKSLLVDGEDFLVTSANFTFHGLTGNIEIGVRLSGKPAHEARRLFGLLVEHDVVRPSDDKDV